ncbi:MAG: hypothetical protein N2484_04280 [Clostridia bacterium]|nr:hypothetical protein [Clostridia bacterium]
MAILQKTLEMRGMPRTDLINYFISLHGKNIGSGKIAGENWEVEVREERLVAIGSLNIPSTIVIFRCDEEFMEPMISAFRLKFLSAGG